MKRQRAGCPAPIPGFEAWIETIHTFRSFSADGRRRAPLRVMNTPCDFARAGSTTNGNGQGSTGGKNYTPLVADVFRTAQKIYHTASGTADSGFLLPLLNLALAGEIACILRYKHPVDEALASEFLKHAGEEMDHADRIGQRIVQLGEQPDFGPEWLVSRKQPSCSIANPAREVIADTLLAERILLRGYRCIQQRIGNRDSTTQALIEDIIADERSQIGRLRELLVQAEAWPMTQP